MLTDGIKTETNDLIVFHNKGERYFWAVFGIVAAFMMFAALGPALSVTELSGRLFFIFFMFMLVLFGLVAVCNYLIDKTVTIDKKFQNIIFQINSPIKRFESVRKIPFSALKEIKITSYNDEGSLIWQVNLIQTPENKPVYVYRTNSESNAHEVGGFLLFSGKL